jgi:hypothetical protein
MRNKAAGQSKKFMEVPLPARRRWRFALKEQSIMAMVLKIHHEYYQRPVLNQTS